MKRVIQRELLDPIALGILQGEFKEGDVITVDVAPDGFAFTRVARKEPVRV